MSIPSLQAGLDRLAGITGKDLEPVSELYKTNAEVAAEAAQRAPELTTNQTIERVRDEVMKTFETEAMGHLLTRYHVNRDKQMMTLASLGKDVILSLISQGILPAQIAEGIDVAYDTFHEFVRLTCTQEEIKHAEALAADSLVAEGVTKLRVAEDKEDLAIARALADNNLKLAKALSGRYSEQKPTTAVQVNNYGDQPDNGTNAGRIPYLQIILPDVADMPPLPEHRFTADRRDEKFKPQGIEDGEFTLYEEDED